MVVVDLEKWKQFHRGECEQWWRVHAVYTCLLDCSPVRPRLMRDLEKNWELCPAKVQSLNIGGLPVWWGNIILAGELFKRFGDLSDIEGFVYKNEQWRLDLDSAFLERFHETGILVPIRNESKIITHIQVYRSTSDAKPFRLRTRLENYTYATA